MKKFLLLALLALPLSLHAQNDDAAVMTTAAATTDMKFGYVSYSTLLETMPDYAVAMRKYAQLEEKYAAETRRVEDEFNAKYEAFLEGQRDFPPTILNKRQSELQELLEKNGIEVITVEFDEILKGYGAMHCCTGFLKRG